MNIDVTQRFFRLKAGVFALVLSVLCVQSHDGVRACVKAFFQTYRHEGSMKAVGHRQQQRVFEVFVFRSEAIRLSLNDVRVRLFIRSLGGTP